jgi:hypothetical protein
LGPYLPASLRALERALQRVDADHRAAIEEIAAASPGTVEDEVTVAVDEPDADALAEPDDVAGAGAEVAPEEWLRS